MTMRAIVSLCLFLVLICTEFHYSYEGKGLSSKRVEEFTCNICYTGKGLSCNGGIFELCLSREGSCISTVGESTIVPNRNLSLAVNKCGGYRNCQNGVFSITTADKKYFNLAGYCCKKKNCNSAAPEYLPYQDLKPNGLQCPGSFKEEFGDTSSGTNETVNCVGNQTQCADIEAKITYKIFLYDKIVTIRGCATPEVCALKRADRMDLRSLVITNKRNPKCYDATPSLPQPGLGVTGV